MARRVADQLLLIGWDAADWQMIRPLIDQGMMPTLARLVAGGVSGNLATIQPVLSPMLWNTIATGKRADKHGICGFVEPRPDRSGIRPVSSTSRKCKALWNILSQSGLRSNVVSWFASHPAEPIAGAIVTDRYVSQCGVLPSDRDFPEGTFHPPGMAADLKRLLVSPADLDADALLPFVPRAVEIDQRTDDRLLKLAHLIARTSTVHAAACWMLQHQPWDFMAIYYSAIDEFGHYFMPYHPPRLAGIAERDFGIYRDVMVGCYRFHDMLLDALLTYAGPETTVILVSDHGFQSQKGRPGLNAWQHPETWHRPFGIACLHGPGIRRGEALYGASLLDVTPTILTLLGLPVGRDMDGRSWLEVLDAHPGADYVDSWESIDGESGQHATELREDPSDAAEAIRQLVALGYLDPPSEDTEETIRKVVRDRKINLAMALAGSRRAAAALPLWEELAREYPQEEGFLLQLALGLANLGRWQECQQVLDRIEGPLRESPYVQLTRAKILFEHEGPEAALAAVEAIMRQEPQDSSLLNRVGELLLRARVWDRAEAVFQQSLVGKGR